MSSRYEGLYASVSNGEMNNLIGYFSNASYEPPKAPYLATDIGFRHIGDAAYTLLKFMFLPFPKLLSTPPKPLKLFNFLDVHALNSIFFKNANKI